MDEPPDLKRRSFLLGKFAAAPQPDEPSFAVIGQACFALRGIACMSCRDACPTGAVRFELAVGGARPRIMTDTCTGCGDCTQSCPADAIRLSASEAAS
ncbi:4Fe-4S ferredoxin [Microvirga sp. KLBC 81]|uniref:4Fe-4S binding protein n=1 Tax=Microvirga sp. KLBC 81 TaxID=1862707 RepID=UPI000D509130|nr:4Fe-4S binding protein [Microvirga sp. KLBC 81]PVE20684.1 4Fe-4S ferredoxin [Microvirga sp. KLBC 81]